MRAVAVLYLPDSGVVRRPTPTQNAIGEATAVWAIEGTVDCRLVFAARQPQFGGKQAEQGGLDRLAVTESWQVVVAHDTDLLLNDRITISSDVYEIVKIDTGRAWAVTRTAEARRIT
ncbi:MAG: hypothetical protein KAY24_00105 [Candidatus Eisenbacteria sp.]|nr:hypothetical protein [Candidatus Eisenbacteria bacterium]